MILFGVRRGDFTALSTCSAERGPVVNVIIECPFLRMICFIFTPVFSFKRRNHGLTVKYLGAHCSSNTTWPVHSDTLRVCLLLNIFFFTFPELLSGLYFYQKLREYVASVTHMLNCQHFTSHITSSIPSIQCLSTRRSFPLLTLVRHLSYSDYTKILFH